MVEVVAKDIGPITKRLEDIRYLHCYCCNFLLLLLLFTSGHQVFTLLLLQFIIVIVYIRLMESRKSARLLNTDTDFSRLADFNIVEQVASAF